MLRSIMAASGVDRLMNGEANKMTAQLVERFLLWAVTVMLAIIGWFLMQGYAQMTTTQQVIIKELTQLQISDAGQTKVLEHLVKQVDKNEAKIEENRQRVRKIEGQ